ncbi:subtilisin-like protein [Jackrogersella minutella]|nr:subtilisin-like protein [Jackrogersella minutella]
MAPSFCFIFSALFAALVQGLKGVRNNTEVIVQIFFTALKIDSITQSFLELSDPTSPVYAKYWSAQQVTEAFKPETQGLEAVEKWLHSFNPLKTSSKLSNSRGHLTFKSTVEDVEVLLKTSCSHVDEHESAQTIRCGPLQIPKDLKSYIDMITVTAEVSHNPRKRQSPLRKQHGLAVRGLEKKASGQALDVDCDTYTSPECLRSLYNISRSVSSPLDGSLGIYEGAWTAWLPEDLDQFFERFEPELKGRRPVAQAIDGGYTQTDYKITPFNLESDLDFEYAMVLTNTTVVNLQVGDKYLLGNLNDMLAAFDVYYCGALDPSTDPVFPDDQPGGYNKSTDCGTLSPPKVVSISYTWPEVDFPPEYLRRQCLEFLKLGLMGVTVVVASGDTGTQSGIAPGTCTDKATKQNSNYTTGMFSPQWPSGCPWVISVGGTQFQTQSGANSTSPTNISTPQSNEIAFNMVLSSGERLSSGGGFSNTIPMPNYQREAVSAYLLREKAHISSLVASGYIGGANGSISTRGFPDVSVMASSYLTVVDGELKAIHGTSASAVVFASMIAMVNADRHRVGKSSVGFVNPTLYANPDIFNDVTSGHNYGCGADPAFRAAKGWDAITGLGSPNYGALHKILMELP